MPLIINSEIVEDAILHEERDFVRQSLPAKAQFHDSDLTDGQIDRIAQQNVISRVLLHQQARQDSVVIQPQEIDDELKRRRGNAQSTICSPGERQAIEQQLRIHHLLARVTRAVQRPDHNELRHYYSENLSQFATPERIHVRQIVKNLDETSDEAEVFHLLSQAEQELGRGKSFAAVANRYSDCSGNGGDLGWITRGEMVEEFEDVVFSLNPGAISSIFKTRFGLHLAQIVERKAAGVCSFQEVRFSLAARIFEARKQRAIAEFLEDAAQKSDIRVLPATSEAAL